MKTNTRPGPTDPHSAIIRFQVIDRMTRFLSKSDLDSIVVTDEAATVTDFLASNDIETLDIIMNKDVDIDFYPLVQMSSLKYVRLKIIEGAIRDGTMSIFFDCESLRTLNIETAQNSSLDLSILSNSSITHLIITASKAHPIMGQILNEIAMAEQFSRCKPQIHEVDLSPLERCLKMTNYSTEFSQDNIDLTPLSSCTGLKNIGIFGGRLTSIDLTPLSSCTRLKEINIKGKGITSIDLSPLRKNTSLEVLNLSDNNLSDIDLRPLSKAPLLELLLDNNNLQRIDLKPLPKTIRKLLISKNNLRYISLIPLRGSAIETLKVDYNKIRRINIEPLFQCEHLREVDLSFNSMRTEVRQIVELSTKRTTEELSVARRAGKYDKGHASLSEWWSILLHEEMKLYGDEEIFPYWWLEELADYEHYYEIADREDYYD